MSKEEILQKLTKDLELRGSSTETIKQYISKVRRYQNYYDKSADAMGETEIRDYLYYLAKEKQYLPATVNLCNHALRFLYAVTLNSELNYKQIPRMRVTRRIPQIYTKAEAYKIIDSARNLRDKSMFMLAYGSGLRVSEITNLKISDIESSHMRILIREGKGGRDRYVMLPQVTLETLREYWKAYRPKDWLFEGKISGGKYNNATLHEGFKAALRKSGLTKDGSMHTLRHCFATHLYEDGHDLLVLKKLLGHVRISSTAWYTHLTDTDVLKLASPIDSFAGRP
jgi:site-specific recombinase XerD